MPPRACPALPRPLPRRCCATARRLISHYRRRRAPARSVIAELTALRSLAMSAWAIDMTSLPPGLTALTVIGCLDGAVVTRLAGGGRGPDEEGEVLPGECEAQDAEF